SDRRKGSRNWLRTMSWRNYICIGSAGCPRVALTGIAQITTIILITRGWMSANSKRRGHDTTRRTLLMAALAGAVAPFPVFAQARVWRVGWLSSDRAVGSPFIAAFRSGLRDLGYIEGKNLIIEERWGEDSPERTEQLAIELARSNVDVIATQGATT